MQIKLIFTRKELGNDLHVLLPIPCSLAVCLYLFLSHLFFFLGPFSRAVVPIWRGFVTNKYFYVRRFSSRQTKLTGGISARKWPSRGKNVRGYCYVFITVPTLIILPAIKLLLWAAHSPMPSPSYLCASTLQIIICQFCPLPAKYIVAASYSVYMKHWLPSRLHWRVPFLLYSILYIVWLETST